MNKRSGILCAGCWTLDQIRIVDHWPDEEALARTLRTDQQGGGSAHNVSIDLRKMDASFPVYTSGMLGHDSAGEFLFDQAVHWKVDTTQLHRTRAASTSFTDVMSVDSSGKRTFFHHSGANDLLTPDHIDFDLCPAQYLHLGLLGVHKQLDEPWGSGPNGWVEVLKRAQEKGLQTNIEMVSIDPQVNRQLALPCLEYLDSLIINDYEAACLSNIKIIDNGKTNADACMQAAEILLQLGSMSLVVVHFPQGAAAVTRHGEKLMVPSVDINTRYVKSSVGAGDAFTAGVLYGVSNQYPLKACIQLGHAVAAASLQSETTVGSVKSVDECLQLAGIKDKRALLSD